MAHMYSAPFAWEGGELARNLGCHLKKITPLPKYSFKGIVRPQSEQCSDQDLVHPARAEGRADDVGQRLTGQDVLPLCLCRASVDGG